MKTGQWLITAALLASAMAAHAEIVASETFAYTDGTLKTLDGGTGWVEAWGGGTELKVVNEKAAVTNISNSNRRTFDTAVTNYFYGVDMSMTGDDNGYAVLYRVDYNNNMLVYFGLQNNTYYLQVGSDAASKVNAGTYTPGEEVRLVASVEKDANGTNEVAKLWVNPYGIHDEPILTVDSVDTGLSGGRRIQIQTIQLDSGVATWDNVTVATEMQDLLLEYTGTQTDLALDLSNTGGNDFSGGTNWVFDFTVDGTGLISVSGGTGDDYYTSFDGADAEVVGSVNDSGLFNSSFSLTMIPSGDSFAASAATAEFGVNSVIDADFGQRMRINSNETITIDWDLSGLPSGYTLQTTPIGNGFVAAGGNYSVDGVKNSDAENFTSLNNTVIDLSSPVLSSGTDPDAFVLGVVDGADPRLNTIGFVIAQSSQLPDAIGDVIIDILPGGTNLTLSWPGTNTVTYAVESTFNLVSGAWVDAVTNIPGLNGDMTVTGAVSDAQHFYRVYIEE